MCWIIMIRVRFGIRGWDSRLRVLSLRFRIWVCSTADVGFGLEVAGEGKRLEVLDCETCSVVRVIHLDVKAGRHLGGFAVWIRYFSVLPF